MTRKINNVDKIRGFSAEDRAALFAKQKGKCLICVVRAATDLDHNHATGEVRALLCNRCNLLLGKVFESAKRLKRLAQRHPERAHLYLAAAKYLEVFGANPRERTAMAHNAKSAKEAANAWLDYYRKNLA